ncbi:MAG: hypothetical protein JWM61_102 [Micrococcaceae bacterium]|jgi:uncharacterized protein (DUF305 family)|uniref:DUF305 domain-containing protein n=1 Tax=Arthrobacter cheniae TaxID=1258888 RepID=A0A3A5MAM6_9MICC|nr:DUF305 domain-containing protein [Arthrobacter cheniae]MCU1631450.1 hypothetical protein [Micrococcaceae bacterium]RJT79126.1 DUF305 domain-containing protein [Arthrobacter cheniae]
MKRYLTLAALGLATALPLSACGTDSGTTGSDTTTGTTSAEAAAPAPSAAAGTSSSTGGSISSDALPSEHNDADVMFAQMMIPHHQQAVEMSDLMLAQDGISLEITELATRIKEAQGPEIGTMTSLLEAWDEPVEPDGGMEGHSMDGTDTGMGSDSGSMEGMLSERQMSELESAEGVEASRIFLESMTAHHEGAIGMARNEIENGQNPEAVELAETIVATQKAEIDEMEELLEGL